MARKKRLFLTLGLALSLAVSVSSNCSAAYAVRVISDPANQSHWAQELAKFAEEINKLQTQIENQMDLINKKALDLMSHGEGDLAGAGKDISSMFQSINSIHDSINAIASDYQKTLNQWDDLMPSAEDWKNKSLTEMANQTAKSRDAWERALQQGLLVTASHDATERTKTQKALDDALRLSKTSKGSVQALQALTQMNAVNASNVQRIGNYIAEANRMRAISDMNRINQEKKAEAFVKQSSEAYDREIQGLKSSADGYKRVYTGSTITR